LRGAGSWISPSRGKGTCLVGRGGELPGDLLPSPGKKNRKVGFHREKGRVSLARRGRGGRISLYGSRPKKRKEDQQSLARTLKNKRVPSAPSPKKGRNTPPPCPSPPAAFMARASSKGEEEVSSRNYEKRGKGGKGGRGFQEGKGKRKGTGEGSRQQRSSWPSL